MIVSECYNCAMSNASRRKDILVKTIRQGEPDSRENEWHNSSPEERIEAVWTLTKLCLAWNNHLPNDLRLQRTVTNLQRSRR